MRIFFVSRSQDQNEMRLDVVNWYQMTSDDVRQNEIHLSAPQVFLWIEYFYDHSVWKYFNQTFIGFKNSFGSSIFLLVNKFEPKSGLSNIVVLLKPPFWEQPIISNFPMLH